MDLFLCHGRRWYNGKIKGDVLVVLVFISSPLVQDLKLRDTTKFTERLHFHFKMPLCNVCSNVYFADLPPFPEDQHGNQLTGLEHVHPLIRQRQFPRSPITSHARHHSSIKGLLQAAAAGCELCTLILGQVDIMLAEIEGLTEEQKLRHQMSYMPTMNLWLTRRRYGRQGFWVLSESCRSNDEKELLLLAAFSFAVMKGSVKPLTCHTSSTLVN